MIKTSIKVIKNNRRVIILMAALVIILSFSLVYVSSSYDALNKNYKSLSTKTFSYSVSNSYGQKYALNSIPIVSVSQNNNKGEVDTSIVKLIPGSNQVLINTFPFVQPDLQYSAAKAVYVAENLANYQENNTDFIYYFNAGDAGLIGGESAGAAITLNTVAALENITLRNDTIITGTINENGTIGDVGGLLEKAQAAANAGYKYFLIPQGQSTITTYQKVQTQRKMGGFTYNTESYVPVTTDLQKTAKDQWGLNVIEVSDINQALSFFESKS